MCPEYVIAAGLWPKIFGKKTLFWYTHKRVNWKLKLAAKLADKIFTASARSFRLASPKVEITGHGIDFEKFIGRPERNNSKEYKIISAGRITPIKNYELLIEAARILEKEGFNFKIEIAGAPRLDEDERHFKRLKGLVSESGLGSKVIFIGPIPHSEINRFYWQGDLFVNFSRTGSIDKAVLEAIAGGCLVLTSNEAFCDILPEKYICRESAEEVAVKIKILFSSIFDEQLREKIIAGNNLKNLSAKIINFFKDGR
jgi:glycosyltransferase involved in cell wall biosynthesis